MLKFGVGFVPPPPTLIHEAIKSRFPQRTLRRLGRGKHREALFSLLEYGAWSDLSSIVSTRPRRTTAQPMIQRSTPCLLPWRYQRPKLWLARAALTLQLACLATMASATELPLARDMTAEARQAALDEKVYVVLFGTRDCPWCSKVRRNHLAPLNRPDADLKVLVREIDIESNERLRDFTGSATTHRGFAQAHRIRFVPVVAFFDERGNPIAEPIVGLSSEDFYGAYLLERIHAARALRP